MGWLWGSSTPPDDNSDPLRDLDPSLREFLQKESPVKYKPAQAPPPPSSESKASKTPTPASDSSTPQVPPESLFPDGRYAYLWKTYTSQATLDDAYKSDNEKLADIFGGYKARKAQIGRAAVENCVQEQIDINECIENGGFRARMTLCRDENRKFERCYVMQSRFLKALGYLSTYERPPEVDEKIQMHADTLYHRMLEQEVAMKEAKARGEPEPVFAPIMGRGLAVSTSLKSSAAVESAAPIPPSPDDISSQSADLSQSLGESRTKSSPQSQEELQKSLKDMTPLELELEERSTQAEVETSREIAARWREVEMARRKRAEEGEWTMRDMLRRLFGMNDLNKKDEG
ncbi:hypothetical protein MMC21_006870 [Puttea exsequens]|nr:hypothetical protein [Puttea exsequens]